MYAPLHISRFQGRSKAFVKIQDGCDRACAFCKIPYVRGRSRSRPLPDLLEEVRRLVDNRRPHTTAWSFHDVVDAAQIKRRAEALREVVVHTASAFAACFVGTRQEVLLEEALEGRGLLTGYSGQFLRVLLEGAPVQLGRLVPVEITGRQGTALRGKISSSTLDNLTHDMPALV